MRRRGLSLIEAVVCVLLLALTVPPIVQSLQSMGDHRADTVTTMRAVLLAGLILETLIADTASRDPSLGFDALANPTTYLDDPARGLRVRLAELTEPYERAGLAYTVEIGPLVNATGSASAEAEENIFRTVTVRVHFNAGLGPQRVMPVSVMVGEM
ncbi:MAG: hypothetical protein LAT64_05805 [Phycisphaerales bacterium]|nr:hypothetical protein [Planctomycetota bacterium]MCH8508271.1 hypothetical protein [Phycisphaerales bacterium]